MPAAIPEEESPTEPVATAGPLEIVELPLPVAGSESGVEEPAPLAPESAADSASCGRDPG
jgi:hypothetical protein